MKIAGWGEIKRALDEVSILLEVVDARFPPVTRSEKLEDLARKRGKSLVIAMNKADLVPRNVLWRWKKEVEKERIPTFPVSARKRLGTLMLRRGLKKCAPELPAKVLIAGYPKVGKSSIINVLKGRHSASTSSVPGSPGYTKGYTLYRIDRNLYILDSPGILPVGGSPLERILRGAELSYLKNPIEAALALISTALEFDPNVMERTYGIEGRNPTNMLEELALKRGLTFKSTKEINISEAAKKLISDFYRGKFSFFMIPQKRIYDASP